MRRSDLADWQEYVRDECQRFYDHCDGETYIFANDERSQEWLARQTYMDRNGKLHATSQSKIASSEELAFTGPWHVVRAYVTTEFRQWVEEYLATERITPLQWVARAKSAREEVDYLESADRSLDQLRELARLIAERDAIICEASARGASKTEIARSVGLSRQQIHTIVAKGAAPVAPIADIADARAAHEIADEAPTEWRQLADGSWVEVF